MEVIDLESEDDDEVVEMPIEPDLDDDVPDDSFAVDALCKLANIQPEAAEIQPEAVEVKPELDAVEEVKDETKKGAEAVKVEETL